MHPDAAFLPSAHHRAAPRPSPIILSCSSQASSDSSRTRSITGNGELSHRAVHPELKQALLDHLEETRTHVTRLEEACAEPDVDPSGKKCKGMEGLLDEGKELMNEEGEDAVKDAGMISAAQRVEHYEIAAYGGALAFATALGETRVADLLAETLAEEEAADAKLTDIADSGVNEAAMAVAGADAEE